MFLKNNFSILWIVVAAFLGFACDDSSDESAPQGDTDTVSENEVDTDENALNPDLYAKILEEGDEAIGGPNAGGRAGDILLSNKYVRFVIQGMGPARSWVPYGGTLIDADLVRDSGGNDLLGELTPVTGFVRAFEPTSIEILEDGTNGETVHVRATGKDGGIPIIDAAIPLSSPNLTVTLDYYLGLEDRHLMITTTAKSADSSYQFDLGDAAVWGNRSKILTPGFGWGVDGLAAHGTFDCQFSVAAPGDYGETGLAYGLFTDGHSLSVLTDQADILPYMGFQGKSEGGSGVTYTRYFAVGQTISDVYQSYSNLRAVALAPLSLNITATDSEDAETRFEIEAIDTDGVVAQYAYAGVGEETMLLPPGTYTLRIGGEGRPWVEMENVVISETSDNSVSLEAPATGWVDFTLGGDHFDGTVRDGLPSKITLQMGHDAHVAAPVLRRVYTASGQGTFLLEPGEYTITGTRGYEYELCRENLTVVAGSENRVNFDCYLERVVDTTGWVVGDLHIHTERSIDAIVRVEDRVIQCAAEGIERTPITDHDTVTVLDPLVEPLGLRDYLKITAGDEVSPLSAHSNGFPMTPPDDRPAYFGVDWTLGYDENGMMMGTKTNPQIWADMRDNHHAGIIQINHPRGSQGFFDWIDYDPILGVDALEDGVFDDNWDTVELINSGGVDTALEQILPDWFSLLNQGYHRAGTAVSDTHTYANPGQARTYMRVGTDDPNEVSDELLVETLKAMRVQAASGPFVTTAIGDAQIGDTATLATGENSIALEIKVQAPSWMPVDWVKVVQNGEFVWESDELEDAVVRLEKTLDFEVTKDSWFVVLAGAPESTLAPEGPGQPVLTVANPIFVDHGGDGYTSPGLPDTNKAQQIISDLKDLGRLFNPLHHHHDTEHVHNQTNVCEHIAGLGDHVFTHDHKQISQLERKIRQAHDHETTTHTHGHHHGHTHEHGHTHHDHDHDEDNVKMHHYGLGSDVAQPFVKCGCARPDLIPTTVLK